MSFPPEPPPGYAPGAQGYGPPGQPTRRQGKTLLVALLAALAVAVLGAGLYFGGVLDPLLDRSKGSSSSGLEVAVAPPAPMPGTGGGTAPTGAGAGGTCPGVVSAGDGAGGRVSGESNRLVVGLGESVTWNGTFVSPITLRQYLDLTREIRPQPTLITRAEPGADAGVVSEVLDVIQQGLGCRPARL